MEPLCSYDIRFSNTPFSLLETTLASTLYVVLHEEIGQKSSIFLVFIFLGINAKKVFLRCFKIKGFLLDSSIYRERSGPKISWKVWKKPMGKPSGPGALSFPSWNATFLTSSKYIDLKRFLFYSSMTRLGISSNNSSLALSPILESLFGRCKKYITTSILTLLCIMMRVPSFLFISMILFWLLLTFVELWKNLTFLSPSFSYVSLDFFPEYLLLSHDFRILTNQFSFFVKIFQIHSKLYQLFIDLYQLILDVPIFIKDVLKGIFVPFF